MYKQWSAALLLSCVAGAGSAQTCNTTCVDGTAPIGRVCQVTVTGVDQTCGGVNFTLIPTATSAMCNIGANGDSMATLSHATASGPNANCVVRFHYYTAGGGCLSDQNVSCTVDASDGLPVELLSFEVER